MRKFLFFVLFIALLSNLNFALAEEPLMINTDTEDISLTDDLKIAKAQAVKYPDNPEAHFNLAIALTRTSLVEEAIKELRKTKKLIRKPENEGVIEKKITEYNEILKNNSEAPDVNNIRYRLAFSHYLKAYYISKQIEKKEKLEKEKNELKSVDKSKKQTSIDLLGSQKLIQIDNNPEIKENLEKSVLYFQDLLKHNPNDEWAKTYYAFILAEQFDEVQSAKSLWNEVIKQNPNNPAPYFFLGELSIKEGKLKQGFMEISQALLLRSMGY